MYEKTNSSNMYLLFLVQRYDESFIYTNLFNQQPYIFSQPSDL